MSPKEKPAFASHFERLLPSSGFCPGLRCHGTSAAQDEHFLMFWLLMAISMPVLHFGQFIVVSRN